MSYKITIVCLSITCWHCEGTGNYKMQTCLKLEYCISLHKILCLTLKISQRHDSTVNMVSNHSETTRLKAACSMWLACDLLQKYSLHLSDWPWLFFRHDTRGCYLIGCQPFCVFSLGYWRWHLFAELLQETGWCRADNLACLLDTLFYTA